MVAVPKKMIPWQNREGLGNPKAFLMTIIEAFISPLDYYEKLEVGEFYQDPLILCFLNSLYLIGPLVPHILSWPSFLAVFFILAATPLSLFAIAFIMTQILSFLDEKREYAKSFYVLAFATPAFVLAYVPGVGYWLATFAFVILVTIGLIQVHKISFPIILATIIFVPSVVLVPYGAVLFAKHWEKNYPPINIEDEAQKVLAVISIAAENYATKNDGNYPGNSAILSMPPQQYLVRDYCGETLNHYKFSCDFRSFGYFLKAQPQGWQGRGKKTFYVSTGGKLRSE